jgi:hypothetical protein
MSPKLLNRFSPRTLVLVLLGLATAAKTLWAMNSRGTCDVALFYAFGEVMKRYGMACLYERGTLFNHTPFTGWMVRQLYDATSNNFAAFAAILRIACALADIVLVLGLLHVRALTGKPPWWALCLFALSPVSVMVSGFHGNIDPIMVMFLFLAAVAVLKDQPVLCGVLFAAACNIKIVPIMVAPVFIFYWMGRGWRPALSFMGTSGALMLAGAAWGLINCPAAFLRNVFGYGSFWGGWGITYWLRLTGIADFQRMDFTGLSASQERVMLIMKVLLLAGLLILAWRRRKLGGLEFFTTLGAAFTWIFAMMPGAGPQYMVWFAPFILLLSPRWWAALTAGSAIFMARFYHSNAGFHFPWDSVFPRGREWPYWGPWTNLVWGTFIALLCCRGAGWLLLGGKSIEGACGTHGNIGKNGERFPRGRPVNPVHPVKIRLS